MKSNPSETERRASDGEAKPALRGDLTQGPILRTMMMFSIPLLISQVIQTLNGSINALWVGQLLGETALAATANANLVMFLVVASIFGLGAATTVRVGQYYGARDVDAARRTFGTGAGFCILTAALVCTAGFAYVDELLRVLGTPAASFALAQDYMRVTFIAIPFAMFSLMLSMGLRGTGDAKTPLHAMILTVVLDAVLNPLLIRGIGPFPAWGIAGSATATAVANFGGSLLILYRIYSRDLALRLKGPELAYLIPRRAELGYIIGKGLPAGAQMLLVSSSQLVVIGLVNREGVHTTAAYSASMQLWSYLQAPAFALSTAVSAMVAQNIGAGHHGRVTDITRVGMWSNVLLTGVLTGFVVLLAHPLLSLFLNGNSPSMPIALHIQYVVSWSYIVMGAMLVQASTMRAYGVVIAPTIIQAIAYYPVRLGFYFLLYPVIGSDALWWSFAASSLASAALTWLLFAKGGWRHRKDKAFPVATKPVEAAPVVEPALP